jgi:phytol kinase
MNPHAAAAMAVLLAGMAGLLVMLRLYQRTCSPHPESVRKLMHLGTGLAALLLPYLFDDPGPVLLLCGAAFAALAVLRYSRSLRSGLGAVVLSTARRSLGELCMPVAVAAVFMLAHRNAVAYSVALLVLAFADSAAALVGTRLSPAPPRGWATLARTSWLPGKTLHGSAAFFVTSFLCAVLPLGLGPMSASRAILVSLTLALVLTLLEAVCTLGLDNLSVPLAALLLLRCLQTMGSRELAWAWLGALLLVLGALVWFAPFGSEPTQSAPANRFHGIGVPSRLRREPGGRYV